MPRRTRAGPKPAIHEDDRSDMERAATLPETPSRAPRATREPLGELVNAANTPQHEGSIILEIDLSKPARKSPRRDRARGADDKENVHEILADSYSVESSPAVEEARYELNVNLGKASPHSTAHDTPHISPSRAVVAARKQLFQQELTVGSATKSKGAPESNSHSSFCSPAQKAHQGCLPVESSSEDSVEALDALEDAIAEIDAAMSPKFPLKDNQKPANSGSGKSQATFRTQAVAIKPNSRSSALKSAPTGQTKSRLQARAQGAAAGEHAKQNQAKAITTPIRKAAGRRSTIGCNTVSRPTSVRKAPFVPARSSKPLTTSTFTLPGDAVAAKLKAQREEREQRRKSGLISATVRGTSFAGPNNRARPGALNAPKNVSSKRTTTNAKTVVQSGGDKITAKPRIGPSTVSYKRCPVRISSAATTTTQINGSTRANIKAPIRSPPKTLTEIFNPPGPDAVAVAISPASKTPSRRDAILRGNRTTGHMAPKAATLRPSAVASKACAGQASLRANRSTASTLGATSGVRTRMIAREQVAQESKARVDAGKEAALRARMEAAEKGRVASREWAERQRLRAAAAAARAKQSEKLEVSVQEVEIGVEKFVV